MRKRNSQQPVLHYLFELGIFLKFLNGLLEVVGGVFLFLSTPQSLSKLAAKLLTNELLEDPRDLVANTLLHAAQRLSANAQVFASVYLLVHGIVKVGLVIALWKKKLRASRRGNRPGSLHSVSGVPLLPLGVTLSGIPDRCGCGYPPALWSEYERVAQAQRTQP